MQPTPAEIIDHIFSFLQSDPTTLTICSRAHPILSPIAERLLFAKIVVVENSNSAYYKDDHCLNFQASDLHKLLIGSPHIANYIRELRICLSHLGRRTEELALSVPMLSQLSSISVESYFEEDWNGLPAEFRDAITHCLSFLKTISINSFGHFPLRLFDNCKTVKNITLCGSTDHHENDYQVVPLFVLDSLSLRRWHSRDSSFLDWTRKHIHSLRSLAFHATSPSTFNMMLPKLVSMFSNSLTSLELELCPGFLAVSGSPEERICLDFCSVPHLKDLTIRAFMWRNVPSFPAITQLLQTAPRLNNLILIFFANNIPDLNQFDWPLLFTPLFHASNKFRHVGLHLCPAARDVVPSVDTLPQLYRSEIISDMIAQGILDIIMTEWN